MKTILALALLFGFGMMVGCGDTTPPKKDTSKSTVTKTTDAKTTGDAAPAPKGT